MQKLVAWLLFFRKRKKKNPKIGGEEVFVTSRSGVSLSPEQRHLETPWPYPAGHVHTSPSHHHHHMTHLQANVPVQRRSQTSSQVKPDASTQVKMSGGGGSSSLGPDVWKDLLNWYVHREQCCT
jgi:hypothetical protein